MSMVSFAKIQSDTKNSIKQAILESLNLIDYSFTKGIDSIVIKPNMCYYWDHTTGQTTDPRFIASLIDVMREEISPSVGISIVESDASAMKCKYAFRILGYEKLSIDYDVKLVNLSKERGEEIVVNVGGHTFHVVLPETIRKADLKVNVPKIKYAVEDIKLTCALKNVFGCNPYPKKFSYHPRLEAAIVAINKVMNFDLCLIDGNIASGAQPRRLGLVVASKDPVAIDAAAARIAGLNPKKIEYLQLAQREGLGIISFSQRGESIRYFRDRYPKTPVTQRITNKAYSLLTRTGIGNMIGLR
jgi:uncharacterized protein (DUF362 family)